jgi:hypothetical protein
VILGFLYLGQKMIVSDSENKYKEAETQIVKLKIEVKEKEEELNNFQQHEAYYQIEHSEEIKSFVDGTFTTLFNYDNKTYVSRFDTLKDRLAKSVISKLKASGEMESPQIEFKNQVIASEVYLTAIDHDQAKALVNLETEYSVGGSKFPRRNEMYEVTVVKDGDKWLIEKLELMGAFQPFEEN